ncbi:shikimate dehydrogenase [Pseudorhodoferax sp.]|uniref:shikimate dehydrogenase n=1 Tax=Pseudorhodoferax sp. TaxID=1993553 RepID=UPI0039E4707F
MNARKGFTLAGVMGWPVSHSRSPRLHGHWIAELGLQGTYVPLPVPPGRVGEAVRGLRALGFAGCNVTIPHKVAVMEHLDEIDPMARQIGAVNTIVVTEDGRLVGRNTDGEGWLRGLRDAQPGWRAEAGPAVVLGAGGAARAVTAALAAAGAPAIRIVNRTREKADALAASLGGVATGHGWAEREALLDGAALLVNTTSQGMKGQPPLDIALERLPRAAVVSDVVYTPLETPLLAAARARGNPTSDGLGMLLNQARPAFAAWFGVEPEVTAELRALMAEGL